MSMTQGFLPPVCPKHNIPMVIVIYERPGSPVGNGWTCTTCTEERAKKWANHQFAPVDIQELVRDGEVWYWQGDGEDHLESLTCPIIIQPEKFIEILKKHNIPLDKL